MDFVPELAPLPAQRCSVGRAWLSARVWASGQDLASHPQADSVAIQTTSVLGPGGAGRESRGTGHVKRGGNGQLVGVQESTAWSPGPASRRDLEAGSRSMEEISRGSRLARTSAGTGPESPVVGIRVEEGWDWGSDASELVAAPILPDSVRVD